MCGAIRLICLLMFGLQAAPLHAHDIYMNLKNQRGVPCCDGNDCRPAHYRVRVWGVQMLIEKTWLDIPQEAVEYRFLEGDTGETNGGHWCGRYQRGSGWRHVQTYCAVLPPTFVSAPLEASISQ
jgi:hypothetical protein